MNVEPVTDEQEGSCTRLFVFDVESIGLHGEAFAVAGGIYTQRGPLREFCFAAPLHEAIGSIEDREWVRENVPYKEIEVTHQRFRDMRSAFWAEWLEARRLGCNAAADCNWPVEANFLSACVADQPEQRKWEGPYPFVDIGSLILAHGGNPLAEFPRIEGEERKHHPLHDARQSARLAFQFLKTDGKNPGIPTRKSDVKPAPIAVEQVLPVSTYSAPLPIEPPEGLLHSMAIRYDHGLAIPQYYDQLSCHQSTSDGAHEDNYNHTITLMRQLYEEVAGHGFFSWPSGAIEYQRQQKLQEPPPLWKRVVKFFLPNDSEAAERISAKRK